MSSVVAKKNGNVRRVPFPEVPKGLKVRYEHLTVQWQPQKKHTTAETREAWMATLTTADENERVDVAHGVAVRSPLDGPNAKIGRAIALRRALHAYKTKKQRSKGGINLFTALPSHG